MRGLFIVHRRVSGEFESAPVVADRNDPCVEAPEVPLHFDSVSHSGWVLIEIPELDQCGYTETDTPSFIRRALKVAW